MNRKKTACVCALLIGVVLTGCRASKLPIYSSGVELRMYGNEVLQEGELASVESTAFGYAGCLFSVQDEGVDIESLRELAPDEDPEEWNTVYAKNKTKSELKAFQLLDVYVEAPEKLSCLCICEAVYSDWKTAEDTYLFIVSLNMAKEDGNWLILSSEHLGTARKENTVIIRDDITNAIKFTGKGGEKE